MTGERTQEERQEERKREYSRRERFFAYWLSRIEGVGAKRAGKLYEYAGSFEAIYHMDETKLTALSFLGEKTGRAIAAAREQLEQRRAEFEGLDRQGISLLLAGEAAYPRRLKNIYDMPVWLFVKGRLPAGDRPCAAVVGARSCSPYGRQEAEYIGRLLAEHGVQVISGMALGVDQAAHRGALAAGGDTFAVLGCGPDLCYPRASRDIYEALSGRGGILSEYGPGEPPLAPHFPVRNRLISGLSDLVIVVEARKKSGSLITADLALEQGREVCALPGRRIDPLSAGCNRLIRQGAAIVTEPEDILDFFHIKCKNSIKSKEKSGNTLAKTEKMVYSCLDSQPRHTEELMARSGLGAGECLLALHQLELRGLALQPANQYYVRKLE